MVAEGRRVIANIERVANLFVTKTVYAMLLAIAVGIARWPYPFLPRHLTIVSSLTIGIPAFFLALGRTRGATCPGFVRRVLRFAVPAGVVAAAATFAVYAVARELDDVLARRGADGGDDRAARRRALGARRARPAVHPAAALLSRRDGARRSSVQLTIPRDRGTSSRSTCRRATSWSCIAVVVVAAAVLEPRRPARSLGAQRRGPGQRVAVSR